MLCQDAQRLFPSECTHIRRPSRLPRLSILAVDQIRDQQLVAKVSQGMIGGDERATRPDVMDQIQGKSTIVHRNPLQASFDHTEQRLVHHQLLQAEGHLGVQGGQVYQVDTRQCRDQ